MYQKIVGFFFIKIIFAWFAYIDFTDHVQYNYMYKSIFELYCYILCMTFGSTKFRLTV